MLVLILHFYDIMLGCTQTVATKMEQRVFSKLRQERNSFKKNIPSKNKFVRAKQNWETTKGYQRTLETMQLADHMIPSDARRWAHERFQKLFAEQFMVMTDQNGSKQASTQYITTMTPHIYPPQTNQYRIPSYQLNASTKPDLLAQAISAKGGNSKRGAQEDNKYDRGSNFKVS